MAAASSPTRRVMTRDMSSAERSREVELRRYAIDCEDVAGSHRLRQLHGGGAEAAEADDGDGLAGAQRRQTKSVIRGCGRAHHHRCGVERDLVGNRDGICGGHHDPLRVSAVDFFAEHAAVVVKVVQCYAAIRAGDDAGDLMAEGERQRDRSATGTIVRIAVADAGRANLDHDLARSGGRFDDLSIDEGGFELRQTNGVHQRSLP